MPASYPGSVKVWTPKTDFVDDYHASHLNETFEEIIAIETNLDAHKTDDTKHLSVMTTQGDLVYRGASAPARLAKGTSLQYLRMNLGATTPEWATLSASDISARVYHSTDQSIATSTSTILAFNSERFDTDSIHDNLTNNSRLTCKTAGKYLIVANIDFAVNATGSRQVNIKLNGTTFISDSQAVAVTGDNTSLSISSLYNLNVNDYIEIKVWQNSGGALNVLAGANYSAEFMMVKVG